MATTVIDLSSLDGGNGFLVEGKFLLGLPGFSVSNAGDINGDGFDDVIIGSPHFPSVPEDQYIPGSSYIVFGKASGFSATLDLSSLDGSNGLRLDGTVTNDQSGRSVSSAGDLNGDGFDDVIVGAPGIGSSYVVFGSASGFSATLNLSSLDGNNGFRLDEAEAYDRIGDSISSAGDVNGDGFADLLVGAPDADPNGDGSGSSYVVFGKASGFDAELDLSNLDSESGFRLDGVAENDFSGSSVSSAGDFNGDGLDDVIVGASNADPNGDRSGSTYVIFGKASGFDAELDLSNLDSKNGLRLDGVAENDGSGSSVSGAGDVNGDGFDDVVISAPGTGSSYVVFGRASGFSAAMDFSSLDGTNGFRIYKEDTYDLTGLSVSSAGDVNGDGFDDVIVGAPYADPNGDESGSSYVVFGKASGFDAGLDLSNLDSESGFRLDGVAENDFSGSSVSSAGDVNGDGFEDVVIAAHNLFGFGDNSGFSYVVFGRSDFGSSNIIEGTPGDDILKGTSAAEIFEANDGNDLLIGRGEADVFRGGAGVDQIKVPDLNFESIDGGEGSDILHIAGKDLNLDLASFGSKIHGIETICIYGRGDNSLSLTAHDVVNLSDTSNTLKLHGNAGDLVTVMDGGWIDGGVNGFYHTYTHEDAVLLVGANLAINFV